MWDTIMDLIPYLMTLLTVLIPSLVLYFKKFSNVTKEFSDVITVVGTTFDEVTDVVVALSEGFADGSLTKAEAKQIAEEAKQVKDAVAPFKKEWKELVAAIKNPVK